MYLHRYLRYTPSLALMILVFTSLTKFLASGPFYSPDTGNCEKYWWTALLHVSVYTNPNEFVRFKGFEITTTFTQLQLLVLRHQLVPHSRFSAVPHQPTFGLPFMENGVQILLVPFVHRLCGSALDIHLNLQQF